MKKVGALLVSLLLSAGIALAQSQGESLGDAARKLRAKKVKGQAVKVYTNDNLARAKPGRVSVVGQGGGSSAAATPAATKGEAEPAAGSAGGGAAAAGAGGGEAGAAGESGEKGEKHWKGKFAEVRNKIASAEKELDLLEREWQLARTQYSQDPNEAMRQQQLGQQAGGKLNELQQKIRQKKGEIDRLKQDLANLENELRREGGNPGWARP